jgi:hypothetical protein
MKKRYIIVEKIELVGEKPYRVVQTKNLIEPTPGELLSTSEVESYTNMANVDIHIKPERKVGK